MHQVIFHYLHCIRTEDWGDDECLLDIEVDGLQTPFLHRSMGEGDYWSMNQSFSFENEVNIKVYDEDSPDPNDLLGQLVIGTDTTSGQTVDFASDSARYQLRYTVSEGAEEGLEIKLDKNQTNSSKTLGSSQQSVRDNYVCRTERKQVTAADPETLLLNPTSNVVYPGAVLDGGSIATGQYRPITARRAPMTLSISLNEGQIGGSTDIEVPQPTLSRVRNKVNELRRRKIDGVSPAKITQEMVEIGSEEKLSLALGAHYKTIAGSLAANLDYSSSTTKNKVLLKFNQLYYTINMDPPERPQDLFAESRQIADDEVYVRSVKYGRTLLFTFESEESIEDLTAAVAFTYGSGGGNAKIETEKVLSKTRTNVLVLGGSSTSAIRLINDGLSGIERFMEDGANYSANTPAEPLSYTLAYVNDSSIANVLLTTVYTERNCVKTTGEFDVKNISIKCTGVDDRGSASEDIYGTIAVKGFAVDNSGNEREIFSKRVWKKSEGNFIALSEGQRARVGDRVRIKFPNFQEVKDNSYILISGHFLDDDDFFDADDDFGTEHIKVHIDSAAPDLNQGSNTNTDGEYSVDFQHGGSKLTLSADVAAI